MKPTETCLSRMEDGFDSRRRYKTANQILTDKSRCLILSFLYVRVAYIYPLSTALGRCLRCKFVANFCNASCNTLLASLVITQPLTQQAYEVSHVDRHPSAEKRLQISREDRNSQQSNV